MAADTAPAAADLGTRHQFHGIQPVLPVADVTRAARYFRDVLGFELDFIAGEPPSYARVKKGDRTYGDPVYIRLWQCPARETRQWRGEIVIHVGQDVDGLHALNAGRLLQGNDALIPCTPLGCLKIIKSIVPDLTGSHAVVIGSSNIVGKPMASLLLEERATVTTTHIHTRDTQFICRGADILVSAVGKPGLVRGSWIKPRAIVIDVGINRITRPDGTTRLVGDVEFDEAREVAGALTPVPGGVGPMTIACLMENTLKAARMRIEAQRVAKAA